MNKKASIVDAFVLIAIAFVTLIFFGIMYYAWGEINTAFGEINITVGHNTSFSSIAEKTSGKLYVGLEQLEYIGMGIIFGMAFLIFISNFLTKAHPVFFVVYLLVTILAFVSSVYVSNAYESLMTGHVFSSVLQGYTAGSFFMLHLPKFIAVIGLLGAIFLFIGVTRDAESGGSVL